VIGGLSLAKTRVVLFGSIGVAVECLEWLLSLEQVEVIGVVCSNEPPSAWRVTIGDRDMREVAPACGVPTLTLDDLLTVEADIGLSLRFHQILRKQHLERFRLGVVNLHGAPLPEMRGAMCNVMAIIENREHFGVSLHWMDTGVDSGDLLAVERFPIAAEDTVYTLFRQCNKRGLRMIKQYFDGIVDGSLIGEPQVEILNRTGGASKTYTYKEALQYKELHLGISEQAAWNRVRAFQFPGHEPAYINTPNGRIVLSVAVPEYLNH
jgi:methionyl-tRNA formyltransferase